MFTVVMFFVLIASFVMMFGLVRFSENVIRTPQLMPLGDAMAKESTDNCEPL